MGDFDKYLEKAKDLAEDAIDGAKILTEDVRSRAKELTEEGSKARELVKNAKEQTTAVSHNVVEKVQDVLQDRGAVREIKQGITQLEALPEVEGSIIYSMELQTALNYLRNLSLIISDSRMDVDSAVEEIKSVMDKVQPAVDVEEELSDEDKAIENVKAIAYSACTRALEVLGKPLAEEQ